MGRNCADCGDWCPCSQFSSNQWRKGEGSSRCKSCVYAYTYNCGECGRSFSDNNQLKMHQQTHRPRNVACPVCGEARFRCGANAVQHLETGYCTGCRGADNARQQIYEFASRQRSLRGFIRDAPMLEYGGSTNYVPELPYECPNCNKAFRQLSQLMQHQEKHNNYRAISY
mmetsp:Transcript_7631/g.8393  ORF Transcript_7631/g.8393 Transcript_7631/m.8393 type:complete len:170 (-) Transcript_7631:212-721(-)